MKNYTRYALRNKITKRPVHVQATIDTDGYVAYELFDEQNSDIGEIWLAGSVTYAREILENVPRPLCKANDYDRPRKELAFLDECYEIIEVNIQI